MPRRDVNPMKLSASILNPIIAKIPASFRFVSLEILNTLLLLFVYLILCLFNEIVGLRDWFNGTFYLIGTGVAAILGYGLIYKSFLTDLSASDLKKACLTALMINVLILIMNFGFGGVFNYLYLWCGGNGIIAYYFIITSSSLLGGLFGMILPVLFPILILLYSKNKRKVKETE